MVERFWGGEAKSKLLGGYSFLSAKYTRFPFRVIDRLLGSVRTLVRKLICKINLIKSEFLRVPADGS